MLQQNTVYSVILYTYSIFAEPCCHSFTYIQIKLYTGQHLLTQPSTTLRQLVQLKEHGSLSVIKNIKLSLPLICVPPSVLPLSGQLIASFFHTSF